MKIKTYSGITKDTTKNLVSNAGVVLVNFDIEKPYEEQKDKIIGATSGGNSITFEPQYREIEIDGVKGKAKGASQIESWEASLTVNVIEFNKDVYLHALGASDAEDVEILEAEYSKITAKNAVTVCDYVDNVTLITSKSGSADPVIFQLYNALNTSGFDAEYQDGDDTVTELVFEAHYDFDDLDTPPFAIFEPKSLIDDEDCGEPEEPGK